MTGPLLTAFFLLLPAVLLSSSCRTADGVGVSALPAAGDTSDMPPPWGNLGFMLERVECGDETVASVCGFLMRKAGDAFQCSTTNYRWEMTLTPAHPDARVTVVMRNAWFTDCLRELIRRGGPVEVSFRKVR